MSEGYAERLASFVSRVDTLKAALTEQGYSLIGNEPLKITISPKFYGYTGCELAKILETQGLVCEFCDRDFVTMMLTPELTDQELTRVEIALCAIPQKEGITELSPTLRPQTRALSLHDALFAESFVLPLAQCEGRILAESRIACPPAIPIVVCGERMDGSAIRCMQYYGVTECRVVKEDL